MIIGKSLVMSKKITHLNVTIYIELLNFKVRKFVGKGEEKY